MHIAIDVRAADLLVESQIVGDRFERIGVIRDQHFRADAVGQFANPSRDGRS